MKNLKKQGKRWLSLFVVTAMVFVSVPQEYLTVQAAETSENRTEESERETTSEVSAADQRETTPEVSEEEETKQPDSDTEQSAATLEREESVETETTQTETKTVSSEPETESETKQETETKETETQTEGQTETETATSEQETTSETEETEETSEILTTETETTEEETTETETTEEVKLEVEDNTARAGGVPEFDEDQKIAFGYGYTLTYNSDGSIASRKENRNVTWKLDNNGTLEVIGTGDICPGGSFYPSWSSNNPDNLNNKDYSSQIKAARINLKGATQAAHLFQNCYNLTKIDLIDFETDKIVSMEGMFDSCKSLTSEELNAFLKNINTSNVKAMDYMFGHCSSLTNLDLSNFDTTNVTDMYGMFEYCSSLTSLDLSRFDTSKVTSISRMFCGCTSLPELDLDSFNTENVKIAEQMFLGCTSLKNLDLHSWVINNLSAGSMFEDCTSLTDINLSGWSFGASGLRRMFYNCKSLTKLDISNWNTSNVTDITDMFYGCDALESLDLSSLDLNKVTLGGDTWLTNNKALESIICPANLSTSNINLPEREGNAWRLPDGKKVTLLPTSNESVTISRNKKAGIEFLGENCTLQGLLDLVGSKLGTFGEKIVDLGTKDDITFTIKPDTDYTVKSVTLALGEESTLVLEKDSEPDQYILSPLDKEKGYTRDEQIKIETVPVAETTLSLTYHTRIEDIILSNGTKEEKNKPESVQISNDKDTSLYVKLNNAYNTDFQEPVLYLTIGEGGERQRITYSLNTEDTTDAEKALLKQGYKIFRLGRLHEDASVEVTTQYILSDDDIAHDNTGDILWVIDKTGRLKITGKGALPRNSDGYPVWYEHRKQITSAVVEWTATGNCRYLFEGCINLTEVDLSGFDVSDVWGFERMFYNCQSLTSLDLSSLDMQNATNTDYMLDECTSLTEIKTPRNLGKNIGLPYRQEIQWRLEDGTPVTVASKEEKESVTIDANRVAIAFERDYYSAENSFVIKDTNGNELKNGLLVPIGSKDAVTFTAEPAEGYVVRTAQINSQDSTITVETGTGINQFVVSPQDMEAGYKKDERISITTDTVQQYPMEINYSCGLNEIENVIIANGSLGQEGKPSTLSTSNAYDTALYIKLNTTKQGIWRPRIEVSSTNANGQHYYSKTLICKQDTALMTEKEKELSEQGYYIYSLGGLYGDTKVDIDLSQYFQVQFTVEGFPGNVRLVHYIDNGSDPTTGKKRWIQEEIKDTLLMEKDRDTYLQAIWEDKDSANKWCRPVFVADDPNAYLNTFSTEGIEGEVQNVRIYQDTKIDVFLSAHTIALEYTLGDLTQITTSEGAFISDDQRDLIVVNGDSVSLSFGLLEGLELRNVSDNMGYGWNVEENNGRYTITFPDITRLYDIKTLYIEIYDPQNRTSLSDPEANCQVTLNFRHFPKNIPVYTGKAIEADYVKVQVRSYNSVGKPRWVTLSKDKDFTVSYVNNVNAGEAQMIITVVPNSREFRGSYIHTFTIEKAQAPESQSKIIQVEIKDQQYTQQANLSELFRIENSDGKEMKPVRYRLSTSYNKGDVLVKEQDPTIEGSILTYTIRSDADKTSPMANLVVYAEFDNYQDCELQINIQVVKKQKLVLGGAITVSDKEYDGKEVVFNTDGLQILSVEGSSEPASAEILAQIKQELTYHYTGIDGTVYDSEQSPLNVGTYKVQAKVAEKSLDYKSDYMEVGTFKIVQRNIKVTAEDVRLYRDDTIPTQYGYHIEGLAEGDNLSTYTFLSCPIQSTATLAEYPIIVQTTAVKIANSEGKDVTANYQITAQDGKLIVCEPEPGSYTVTYKMSDPLRPELDIKRSGNEAGMLIEKPVDPIADGYVFLGWFTDAASTKEWNFAVDIIQSDITLYAGWSRTVSEDSGIALCVQEILPQTYTGKALKPSVTVFAADGKTRLKLKTDYTVTYKNNTNADTKTFSDGDIPQGGRGENLDDTSEGFDKRLPYVIITGKGNYTGKVYANFHIEPADISKAESGDSKFTLKYTDQFDEKPGKYASIVTQFKYQNKKLKYGIDYTLDVQKAGAESDSSAVSLNNKGQLPLTNGTYQLTITGIGNYSGVLSGKVLQVADKTKLLKNAKVSGISAVSNVMKDQLEKGVELDSFEVKLNGITLTKDTDYEVKYINNHAIGNATVLITAKEQSGYIGSKSVSFKIKGAAFKANAVQMTGGEDELPYTGKALTQNQVVLKTNDGKDLVYGTDYTTSYKNNIKKGNATIVFTAKPSSGYTGSFSKKFKIVPMDLSTALNKEDLLIDGAERTDSGWKLSESIPYQKGGATAADKISLQLKATGTTLIAGKGKDYTVSYTNNKELGTASMTLKGAGNYTGEIMIPFEIEKASLSSLYEEGRVTITSASIKVTYSRPKDEDGEEGDLKNSDTEFKPAVTIKDGKSKLKKEVDYTIEYSENTRGELEDSNVLKATIKGLGNYAIPDDEISLEISVNRINLSKKPVKVYWDNEDGKYTYTGEEIRPSIEVEYSPGTHKEDADEPYDPPQYDDDGNEKYPQITVRDWESISEGSDYRVEYSKNIAKGTATIKIIGIGGYTGSVSKTFQITSKEIYNKDREPDDEDWEEDFE